LPNLKSLTFSSNHLKTFEIPSATDASDTKRPSGVDVPHAERRERWFPNLQELNLDWNDLDDWSRLGFLGELAGCVD
jgi:Leucine-rich repeat (LRR) protein